MSSEWIINDRRFGDVLRDARRQTLWGKSLPAWRLQPRASGITLRGH